MATPDLARIEQVFDRASGRYDRMMGLVEPTLLRGMRDWATGQADGRVVEIAVGSGLNLPLYGPEVTSVVGVDLSEELLTIARQRATAARPADVDLRRATSSASSCRIPRRTP